MAGNPASPATDVLQEDRAPEAVRQLPLLSACGCGSGCGCGCQSGAPCKCGGRC